MPSREQVEQAVEEVEALREQHRGKIVIDAVMPDYYARFPKPCMGGWGRRSLNVTPAGRVLPCHAAEVIPGLEFWIGARAFAGRHLARIRPPSTHFAARTGCRSRAAAARCRRRISAAAAAKRFCSPAMRATPIRSVISRRTTPTSPSWPLPTPTTLTLIADNEACASAPSALCYSSRALWGRGERKAATTGGCTCANPHAGALSLVL